MNLTSDVELAEEFGITLERLHVLRKRNRWPYVQLGRFDIRFTDEQVAQIVAMHSEAPAKPKAGAPVAVAGQTKASASRRRTA